MRLNIVEAGIISIEGKPSEKSKIDTTSRAFGKFADVDFCIDESDDMETVIVGTYDKRFSTIEEIRYLWKRFKNPNLI
jgi:hypothetical protein